MLLFPILLLGCHQSEDSGPASKSGAQNDNTDSNTTDSNTTDSNTTDSADTIPDYFNPGYVSFEPRVGYDAESRLLTEWIGPSEEDPTSPYVIVTLADDPFFEATTDEEIARHSCVLYFSYASIPADLEAYEPGDPDAFNPWATKGAPAAPWASWDGSLGFLGYGDATTCENLDPALWPGGAPASTFEGMRFGLAFAAPTEFTAIAWDEETEALYEGQWFTGYIAVNHPTAAGGVEFVAFDWTAGLLCEWTEPGGEVLTEPGEDGLSALVGKAMEDGAASGWVYTRAVWFEDFPNLDFDLLRDGVP